MHVRTPVHAIIDRATPAPSSYAGHNGGIDGPSGGSAAATPPVLELRIHAQVVMDDGDVCEYRSVPIKFELVPKK